MQKISNLSSYLLFSALAMTHYLNLILFKLVHFEGFLPLAPSTLINKTTILPLHKKQSKEVGLFLQIT